MGTEEGWLVGKPDEKRWTAAKGSRVPVDKRAGQEVMVDEKGRAKRGRKEEPVGREGGAKGGEGE